MLWIWPATWIVVARRKLGCSSATILSISVRHAAEIGALHAGIDVETGWMLVWLLLVGSVAL